MIPHIVRVIVKRDCAHALLASAIVGANFLVWANIAARTIIAPEDIPVGIVTGLIDGAFFIWILRRGA